MVHKLRFLSAMFIFGTIGLFVRAIPLPSSAIALVRAAIGTLFLLVLIRTKGRKLDIPSVKRNLKKPMLSGLFMGMEWIMLFESYRYTTVAVATLCYYFSAIFVMVASPLILKEKLTPFKAVCALVAVIGMVLVSGVLDAEAAFSPAGVALGLCAAVLYAGIVLINKQLDSIDSYDSTSMQLLTAAVVLLPYVLVTENVTAFTLDPLGLVLLLTLAVVHTGFAYGLYFSSMRRIDTMTVAIFSYLDPVVALLLSVFVLREPMTLLGAVGAVLVLAAMFASELPSLNQKSVKG